MKITEGLKLAREILARAGVAEPLREADSLLSLALGRSKAFLIAHPDYELSEEECELFKSYLERRAKREPMQYIRGSQEFYGLDFTISSDVLIPRPETELVVENAIKFLEGKANSRFCDVGIGSGCIAISILVNVKHVSAVGCDISEKALQIAKQNAEKHGVSDRLELRLSDVFSSFANERFDLIVSNPPYISEEEFPSLQEEVRKYEPKNALLGGKDGLDIIGKMVTQSPQFLNSEGALIMEIGFGQSEKVLSFFDEKSWSDVKVLRDFQGIPRVIFASR